MVEDLFLYKRIRARTFKKVFSSRNAKIIKAIQNSRSAVGRETTAEEVD